MISAWRPFKAWVPVDILSKVNAGMIEDVFRGSPKGTGESNEAGRYRYSI